MGISVLGPLRLDDSASRLSPRETLVLAALTVAGDESLSADQLSEAVWGDSPPASWHKNLQTCVVRLRKVLGPEAIETTSPGYQLALPVDAVDARRFEALTSRGHELIEVGEADIENGLLRIALKRVIPEAMKPRKIEIGSDAPGGRRIQATKTQALEIA